MDELIHQLTRVGLEGLIGLVMMLVAVILNKVRQKYNISILQDAEARVKARIRDEILAIEEDVEAKIKKGTMGVVNKAFVKQRQGVKAVFKHVPGISEAEAERILRSELPKLGLGAAGFLGEVARAMVTKNDQAPTPKA